MWNNTATPQRILEDIPDLPDILTTSANNLVRRILCLIITISQILEVY